MTAIIFLPDIIIFCVIFIFGCKGLGNGFTKSIASLVGSVLSLAGAIIFSVDLADYFAIKFPRFPSPQLLSYLVIFFALLTIFRIISYNMFRYKRDDLIGPGSRLIAFPVGLIEGIVYLLFFTGLLVFQDLFLLEESFWQRSILIRLDINSIPLFRTF